MIVPFILRPCLQKALDANIRKSWRGARTIIRGNRPIRELGHYWLWVLYDFRCALALALVFTRHVFLVWDCSKHRSYRLVLSGALSLVSYISSFMLYKIGCVLLLAVLTHEKSFLKLEGKMRISARPPCNILCFINWFIHLSVYQIFNYFIKVFFYISAGSLWPCLCHGAQHCYVNRARSKYGTAGR